MAKGFCLNENIRTKTLKQDKNDCTTYAAIALAKQYKKIHQPLCNQTTINRWQVRVNVGLGEG